MVRAEEKKNRFKDKRVIVVGLARSGTGAANLLSLCGAKKVCITDIKSQDSLRDNIKKLLPSIEVIAGEHPVEVFNTADLIVVSPGVPFNIPPLADAKAKGIPVIGELELAYQVIEIEGSRSDPQRRPASGRQSKRPSAKTRIGKSEVRKKTIAYPTPAFIAVTGTNGKSTTTTLIDRMLKKSGFMTLLGGNIGNALTEELNKLKLKSERLEADYIVTEVSSFQLESMQSFRPLIAVILNITPDHLDRYAGMQEYIDAKAGIFKNQGYGDYLILNADDPATTRLGNMNLELSNRKIPKILFFSRKKEVEGIYCKDDRLIFKQLPAPRTAPPAFLRKQEGRAVSYPLELIAVDEIKIKGVHNLENAMAASLAAFISGCTGEAIRSVLRDFSGLEHRLEFVCEIKGVSFINDSKGTNIGAVAKSLESLRKVVLIMGGRDKDGDFASLKNLIKKKVKALILLGEAREKIEKAVGRVTDTILVNGIKEAVELSMSKAYAGDVVLLSPGCASFDMFTGFEDRGEKFKEAVREIAK